MLHPEPPAGWVNDPNGLCRFQGLYHVFLQHCPDDATGHGEKCWGHFTTQDWLRWFWHGTPLTPDHPADQSGVYSGSALAHGGLLHLFYTGNVRTTGDGITAGREANVMHVTSPNGFAFSKKQVVLTNAAYPADCSLHVRDPLVRRVGNRFVMLLGARTKKNCGCVLLYHSKNLCDWTYAGRIDTALPFGYMWECPDWITVGARQFLSICPQGLSHGETRFQNPHQAGYLPLSAPTPQTIDPTALREWDMGFDFYAPQTFAAPDGRRILLGWMGVPDAPWRNPTAALGRQHCLTFPRELSADASGRLRQLPVRELSRLRLQGNALCDGVRKRFSPPFELEVNCSDRFRITLCRALTLSCDRADGLCELRFLRDTLGGGRTVRKAAIPRVTRLRVLVDAASAEFFLNDGETVFSTRFYPSEYPISVDLSGCGGVLFPLRPLEVTYLA